MSSFYEDIINDTVKEFVANVIKGVQDKNTIPVALSDPPLKKATSYPIHRAVFAKAFGTKLRSDEKIPTAANVLDVTYKITTLERVQDIFGIKPLINFNKFNDFCILSPLMVITKSFDNYSAGVLVLPIKNTPDGISVFVPGGPDDDKNNSFISLRQIILGFKPELLPERHLEGHPLSIKKGTDYVSIVATNDVQEGDYLVVRGKSYRIYAKTDDDCFTFKEGERNVIRISGTFKNNVKRQRFRYKKMPMVCGFITNIDADFLRPHNQMEIKFSINKNGNNHGLANILFYNIVFNAEGYVTQDRYIVVAP